MTLYVVHRDLFALFANAFQGAAKKGGSGDDDEDDEE